MGNAGDSFLYNNSIEMLQRQGLLNRKKDSDDAKLKKIIVVKDQSVQIS